MLHLYYKSFCALFFLAVSLAFFACSNDAGENGNEFGAAGSNSSSSGWVNPGSSSSSVVVLGSSSSFGGALSSNSDATAGRVTIKYNEGSAPEINNPYPSSVLTSVNGEHVSVTIRGTETEYDFELSGVAQNGSFKLYGDFKWGLYLNGVRIANSTGAAINIQNGKRAVVNLVSGTQNFLTDGATYQTVSNEDMKGAFFSEGQLIFEGTGSLEVTSRSKHGICSDDFVRINNGNIKITAETDGIHANESFEMSGGNLDITAKSDGIDVEKGNVEISGGVIKGTVTGQGGKGIKSAGNIAISGGSFDLSITGNAYHNTEDKDNKSPAGIKSDGNITISNNPAINIAATGSGGKGINSAGTLTIGGGTIDIKTSGAQFSYRLSSSISNGWRESGNTGCTASGGMISAASYCPVTSNTMTSSAKGIKSQGDMTINDGKITISTSTTGAEGMESKAKMTINGGDINITANDDAINSRKDLTINGGKLYLYSTTNDGIDVNGLCYCGNLYIKGGLIVASGVNNSQEEGIDADAEYSNTRFEITGGTLIGVGGKTDKVSTTSTQRVLVWNSSTFTQNQVVSIRATSGGAEVMSFKMPRQYSSMGMVFSSPKLLGNTGYTIYKGGTVSGGTEFNGFSDNGTSSGGTSAATFTTSSMVTTVGSSGGWGW